MTSTSEPRAALEEALGQTGHALTASASDNAGNTAAVCLPIAGILRDNDGGGAWDGITIDLHGEGGVARRDVLGCSGASGDEAGGGKRWPCLRLDG